MSRYGEMRYNLENIDKIEKDDTLVYSWKTSVGKTIEIWFENKVIIGTILNIKNKKCQIKTSCGFEFYCSTKYLINNTTNIELAKYLNPIKNSVLDLRPDLLKYVDNNILSNLSLTSNVYVDCICPICKTKKKLSLHKLLYFDFKCNTCKDTSSSFAEKILMGIFKELNIEYIREVNFKYFEWIGTYRYDFYLEKYKTFVEIDGAFHTQAIRGEYRLNKTIQSDDIKTKLIDDNGYKLIRIPCIECDFKNIKNNIIKSDLGLILDIGSVNWDNVIKYTKTNKMEEICRCWMDGNNTISEISSKFKLNQTTITKYLKIGTDIWDWCEYNPNENRVIGTLKLIEYNIKNNSKPISVYKDGILLGIYKSSAYLDSISLVDFGVHLNKKGIRRQVLGKRKQYKGFTFIELEK